ncbi:hypothetical protein [Exiguobacterium sp. s142]|uniref:hypothetical protein n=1 Tax=Exiguobacterium sp. s142 TaxID=2751222 RepID=UPI001BE693F2|nr:hypothetical protein [Exiguobacterium sp. s142]
MEDRLKQLIQYIDEFDRQGPYKMNVLKIMLERGYEDWHAPISITELARPYYDLVSKQHSTYLLKNISKDFTTPFSQAKVERHLRTLPLKCLSTTSTRISNISPPFELVDNMFYVREEYRIDGKAALDRIINVVEQKFEEYLEVYSER